MSASKMAEELVLTGVVARARMDSNGFSRRLWLKTNAIDKNGAEWLECSYTVDAYIDELTKIKAWYQAQIDKRK